jgi:hypothetical protein
MTNATMIVLLMRLRRETGWRFRSKGHYSYTPIYVVVTRPGNTTQSEDAQIEGFFTDSAFEKGKVILVTGRGGP